MKNVSGWWVLTDECRIENSIEISKKQQIWAKEGEEKLVAQIIYTLSWNLTFLKLRERSVCTRIVSFHLDK